MQIAESKTGSPGQTDFLEKPGRGKNDALTSLRFVTALWVFLFHVHLWWPLQTGFFLNALWSVGAFGMTFFFILSGFILATRYSAELAGDRFTYRHYLLARVARIYPNYLFILALSFPLIDWTTAPLRGSMTGGVLAAGAHLASAGALVSAAILSVQGFFYSNFYFWLNTGTWSLSVEWLCYLLFPVVVRTCAGLTPRQAWRAFFGLALVSGLMGLIGFLTKNPTPSLYAHPALRFPEFVMGVLAFRLAGNFNLRTSPFAFCLGLAAYSVAAGLTVRGNYIMHNWAVAPLIGLIIISTVNNERFAKLLSYRMLVYLGETSYAFYLFQLFVILVAKRLVPPGTNGLVVFVVGLPLTQVGASLMYHLLEVPARRWMADRKNGPFRTFFAGE